jgi:muramoyltetrapeptide carboxypeptidase LdcA involved in peptidoglycan recycling
MEVKAMRYPPFLKSGDTIGVCAPSSGIGEGLAARLDKAAANVRALGYEVLETPSVRHNVKCVSADAETRAAEFMCLYENPAVAAIIPPWGGEFLMDMLPCLDFRRLSELPPKWICGYSDISTLTFALTVSCDVASVHGSNFMNMGYSSIHASDLLAFEVMSKADTVQRSSEYWGGFSGNDLDKEIYKLDKKTEWKPLHSEASMRFEGRMIGGCLDILCKLIGTRFAPVPAFLEKYKNDGFIWTLESCEMNAADIYRSLWHMRECGWFEHCNGVLYGRADGYSANYGFELTDALEHCFGAYSVPVIYDADIGHLPPQTQIVNGALGAVDFRDGIATIRQVIQEG